MAQGVGVWFPLRSAALLLWWVLLHMLCGCCNHMRRNAGAGDLRLGVFGAGRGCLKLRGS